MITPRIAVIVVRSCKTCPYCAPLTREGYEHAKHKCTAYPGRGWSPIPDHYFVSDEVQPTCPFTAHRISECNSEVQP